MVKGPQKEINYNVIFAIILIIVNMHSLSLKAFYQSLGSSLVQFFIVGLILGNAIAYIFVVFHNSFRPLNKIAMTTKARIAAGLVCAILYSLALR